MADPFCLNRACFQAGVRASLGHRCCVFDRREARRAKQGSGRATDALRRACEEVLHRKSSRMTPEECRKFYHSTGHKVRDASDVKKVYAKTGLRDAEPGEHSYAMMDALKECAESGKPLDPRYGLESLDLFGDYAKAKPFDAQARFRAYQAYHRARGIEE